MWFCPLQEWQEFAMFIIAQPYDTLMSVPQHIWSQMAALLFHKSELFFNTYFNTLNFIYYTLFQIKYIDNNNKKLIENYQGIRIDSSCSWVDELLAETLPISEFYLNTDTENNNNNNNFEIATDMDKCMRSKCDQSQVWNESIFH